jgi:hypothetical protein
MRVYFWPGALAAVAILAGIAQAKDKTPAPPPQAWQDMVKCRQIAEPSARLACFDAQVAKVEQAAANGDLVLADRESVRRTKRGLFGFGIPGGGLLGDSDDKNAEEISEIDSTVGSARQFGYGAWRITLADGSVWEQTDETKLVFDPRSGSKVHIYKGAMGTYRVNIDGQRALKMRRVQ